MSVPIRTTENCSVTVAIRSWTIQSDSDHEEHWTLQCDIDHNELKIQIDSDY